jgi:hypothetical protein
VQTNGLLDELLENSTETSDDSMKLLIDLFNSKEDADQFIAELPTHVLNLWANNNRIIHIITPPGVTPAIKSIFNTADMPGVQGELEKVYISLKDSIQYSEDEEVKEVKIITLKQAIAGQELISVHGWVNDPTINLYEALRKANLTVQPTMEELRLLALVNTLLDIRESQNSKLVIPRKPTIQKIV